MEQTTQHIERRGGRRVGSGSKPLPSGEKKVLLRVYVKGKYLAALGNDRAKGMAEDVISKEGGLIINNNGKK